MKKIALNKETVRQLETQDLILVQGGVSGNVNCHISRSCYTRIACHTEWC